MRNTPAGDDGTEPLIQLSGLTKKYGDFTAVNKLSLSIRRGEIFGLLGPNGAGKSTTILMMLGLTEPTAGKALVCGVDATRQPMLVKRRVGYLPDDVGFYDDRTGMENLLYTASLNRIPLAEARDRAALLLERVGLQEAAGKRAGAYSRGMRQRLGLADVLIKQPEIIILDEPTLGIDPEGVRELLELIRGLSRDEGITVLLSSHHLHQVQQICDRVGLFVKGSLLATGTVAELSEQLFAGEPYLIELEVGFSEESAAAEETERLLSSFSRVNGVLQIRVGERHAGQFTASCSRDATAELARAVVESGASLQALNRKTYGLDEIYHRYFEGGKPA